MLLVFFLDKMIHDAVDLLREMVENVDQELRNQANCPSVSSTVEEQEVYSASSPPHSQQQGAGVVKTPQTGPIEFVLQPLVECKWKRMGVHERVFETRVQQIGPMLRGQNLTHALTHGLRRALERLLDNPDIEDRDRIFFSLSSDRLDNNFTARDFEHENGVMI